MKYKHYYWFTWIIFLVILFILIIVEQVIDNECRNSPVEQFRNSEYCEVE